MRRTIHFGLTLGIVVLGLAACASKDPISSTSSATPEGAPRPFVESGFLTDYSGLVPVEPGAVRHTYQNPETKFADYDKILFDRITIWRDVEDTETVESDDFQKVADDLYSLIAEQVSRRFGLAAVAGPRVARMRLALVGIDEADDQLDVYVTQAAPTAADVDEPLPPGLREFGRDAWLEAEMLDSVTGEVLFSVVDRAANVIPRPKPPETWRDLHDVFAAWAEIISQRLGALHDAKP
jgi:hypothetical protein